MVARPRSSPAHHRPAAAARPITPAVSISHAILRSSPALLALRGAPFGSRRSIRAMANAGRLDSANTMAARLTSPTVASSVQRAGVDDRLRCAVAAQHHEQVADHDGLALLVALDHAVLLQLVERHLDHAHRTGHDARACGDDRVGMLDRKSTRLNSSHYCASRMPSS